MTLTSLLADAGLTGRGGAAFSTARKVEAAHAHGAHLVVNACDGELGATKDGWVVTHHLAELVEGAAAVASGAPTTYAAHRGSDTAHRLRAAGLPVLEVPARYVSSEETSIISLAQGGLARPMTRRQPFVRGGHDSAGRRISPTVVLNAETVWRVGQVVRHGPEWFRSFGTLDEPGPRLVSVSTPSARGVVVEAAAGVPVRDLLSAAGLHHGGLPDGSPAAARRWPRWHVRRPRRPDRPRLVRCRPRPGRGSHRARRRRGARPGRAAPSSSSTAAWPGPRASPPDSAARACSGCLRSRRSGTR